MKTFNFFEPYLEKSYKKLVLFISFGIGILLLIYPLINIYQISRMEKEVTVINHRVDTPEEIVLTKEMQKEIKRLDTTLRDLKKLDTLTKEKDVVNDFLVYTICNNVPESLFFKSFHITSENVQIEGISKNKIAIAQFKHSLEKIIYFQNIYIPSISEDKDGYTFTLFFHIGDDNKDEAN